MKLAIITTDFCESTLSLQRALVDKGHHVDCYITFFNQGNGRLACLEIPNLYRAIGSIEEIDYANSKGCSFARDNSQARIFTYQCFHSGLTQKGVKKYVLSTICKFYLKYFAKHLNSQNYDCIDIISQNDLIHKMDKWLTTKTLHSFHEVLKSHLDNKILNPTVEWLLNSGRNIRVFSDKSYNDICDYSRKNFNNLYSIPFGLFLNYSDFHVVDVPEVNGVDNYVLMYGYITKYKGISVLYDAIKEVRKKDVDNIKIVIAGLQNDPFIKTIENDNQFLFINRFLSNDELVSVINKSRLVVCPYLSASQSGIPQTVFFFGKPIIASNIGTFADLVVTGKTGILIKPNDPESLATAIIRMYTDDGFYSKCVEGCHDIETISPQYSWKSISEKYLAVVKSIEK